MPSSSRKPATFSPPAQPAAYWPRAVVRSRRRGSTTLESTFCFSMRRLSASNDVGSSIATSAHQLEQVVLDHVAGGADAVVVAGPAADADVLGHGDLHVVDVVGVPDRLEQRRWRSASPGCSGPSPCRGSGRSGRSSRTGRPSARMSLSSRADSRSWPNGFSTTTRRHEPSALLGEPVLLELADHVAEEARRDREVEGVVAAGAAHLVELLDGAPQPCRTPRRRRSRPARTGSPRPAAARPPRGTRCGRAALTESCTICAKSWSAQSRRAKPTRLKPGGSSPRLARS